MNPIVNNSIKPFVKIKGSPASSSRVVSSTDDWGSKDIIPTSIQTKLFKTPDDINSVLKQIGSDPSYNIQLPCLEVNEMPNKRINTGLGVPFDKSLVKPKPLDNFNTLTFNKAERTSAGGIDISQKPFTFSSWNSSSV